MATSTPRKWPAPVVNIGGITSKVKKQKTFFMSWRKTFLSGGDTPGLVDSRQGRNGGTWVHPRVAIHFASWISPKFAAAVTDVVDRYTKGEVSE